MSTSQHRRQTPRLAISLAAAILISNTDFGSAFTTSTGIITSNTPQLRESCHHHNYLARTTRRTIPCFNDMNPDTEGRSRSSSMFQDYKQELNAGPIAEKCRLTEDQIHQLLSKRRAYQRKQQFEDADKILTGLNECGVYVHDKRREWRADGLNHFGRNGGYIRRGGTYGLSGLDIRAVSQIVEDRAYAKKNKKFHISDELEDALKTKYQVKVNDKLREWSIVVSNWEKNVGLGDYVPSPLAPPEDPTHTMDGGLKTQIAEQLADRVAFRKKKDFGKADEIRDELVGKYSIVIDDRTREWKVVLGEGDDDDVFVRNAQLSQRSAFVRRGNNNTSDNETTKKHDEITTISEKDTILSNNEEEVSVKQVDLGSLTVVELKEQLRQAGLPVSGKKADLILRLNAE